MLWSLHPVLMRLSSTTRSAAGTRKAPQATYWFDDYIWEDQRVIRRPATVVRTRTVRQFVLNRSLRDGSTVQTSMPLSRMKYLPMWKLGLLIGTQRIFQINDTNMQTHLWLGRHLSAMVTVIRKHITPEALFRSRNPLACKKVIWSSGPATLPKEHGAQ